MSDMGDTQKIVVQNPFRDLEMNQVVDQLRNIEMILVATERLPFAATDPWIVEGLETTATLLEQLARRLHTLANKKRRETEELQEIAMWPKRPLRERPER